MLAGSLLLVFCLLGRALLTIAQSTNATCAPSHKWAYNSHQQSPCVVASSLLAVCYGAYNVAALPDQFHYGGPDIQNANLCQCNTVVYSLLAECGLCQNRTAVMWSVWETNCPSVSISSFLKPIPAGLHVPGWAYLDVKAGDMFNETLAQINANITESTAVPVPTRTSSATTSIATSSAAPQPSSELHSSNVSPLNQTRSNAVGGGIVGGFALLVLISAAALYIHKRRRRAKTNGEILNSPVMSQHRTDALPNCSQPTIARALPSVTAPSLNTQLGSGSIRSGQTSL
ncbi:hypothetical protein B0H15DRAFT_822518 [Mycena belliarum]|uniref:Transmembrane protein n=1 Tax=Mycena belliarum TaxID=1033014 RepID=A0AAD6XUW4_9AGAR|nr:hypothetical protein B0H15DRAFT_822518 [Mycena belliae]